MTATTNTTANAVIINDNLAHALDAIVKASKGNAGATARATVAIVQAVLASETGNGTPLSGPVAVRNAEGKRTKAMHDLAITRDMLSDYAHGKLSKDAISDMFDAIVSHSPEAEKARKAYKAFSDMALADRALFAGQIEVAKGIAAAATQTIRRPLRMAALLLTDAAFAPDTVKAEKNAVTVEHTVTAGEHSVTKRRALSDKQVSEYLAKLATSAGNAPAKRNRDASKKNVEANDVIDNAGNVLAVTMTAEAFKRGGEARSKLADHVEAFAAMLAKIDGKPTNRNEREAFAHLWRVIGDMLDDDAKAKANSDANAAAIGATETTPRLPRVRRVNDRA